MKLNETIRRLRRAKALTQEQVAQALGVSGPAVNKWERGACCPDLALLAPLARLLDTDLNTLLSFREELTGAEIAAFTEELYTLAQSRGIDAAFLRAEELLHRWPGCDRLTISLAMTLNGLFFTLGVAEPEPYERRLEPLYRALADSEEPDIRDQALHLLIGRHMRREEYAAAEELLSSLSDRWPHRDALQAGLLRRTGRGEEAAELWERRLLNAATEVYESLVSLQELALQAERLEDGALRPHSRRRLLRTAPTGRGRGGQDGRPVCLAGYAGGAQPLLGRRGALSPPSARYAGGRRVRSVARPAAGAPAGARTGFPPGRAGISGPAETLWRRGGLKGPPPQLVEKVLSTSCWTFEHFKKVLKSRLIGRERPRPVSLGLRPIHLQTTLTVFLHTIFPSESFR